MKRNVTFYVEAWDWENSADGHRAKAMLEDELHFAAGDVRQGIADTLAGDDDFPDELSQMIDKVLERVFRDYADYPSCGHTLSVEVIE